MNVRRFIILLVLIGLCQSEWIARGCPSRCVCHQMWVEALQMKLNALDCKERDMAALDSVPIDTEALVLRGNQLHVDTLSHHNLSGVLYIDLSNNQLKLHQVQALKAFFSQLQSLRALDLSDNYLETIQTSLFKELKSLEFLSLSGNSIVYIERTTFEALTNLKILKLNNNHLRRIDENWFNNGGSSLRDLDLSSNRIESLQGGELMKLTALERLKVSNNNLSFIHSEAFVKLMIRELHLDSNQLRTAPTEALLPLTDLAILNLNHNPIPSLDEKSIVHLPNLKQISLNNMINLQVVYKSAFQNLPNLLRAELFDNPKLEYVHPASFVNCTKLEALYLHGNYLHGLDETILGSLPKLRELSLYNNHIKCNCLAKWIRNTTIYIVDGDKIVCDSPHAVRLATLYELTDAQIDRECAPEVLLQGESSISADFGTDLELRCQALGSDSLTWSKTEHSNRSLTSDEGLLQLRMIQHSDEGIYTCVATSSSGHSDSASVEIRVIHSVIMLKTITVSKSFMVLKWDDTQGSTILSYGTGRGNSKEVIIPPEVTQYTLENLKPDFDYVVCLLYHHRLEQSCISVHMLPSARADTPSEDNSFIYPNQVTVRSVVITVVVIVAFITLTIAITIIYKKCRRRQQSKIVYLRQKNDRTAVNEINAHITLEGCYNPTTVPLCENELT